MEPHIPGITGVIQLAVAPVFMLTAVGTILAALNIRLGRVVAALFVLAVASLTISLLLFLREIFLAVSTPRHVPQ